MPFKVLSIPTGQTRNAEGETVGTNWLIASMGAAEGYEWHVTTNRIHASEYGDLQDDVDFSPHRCAQILSEAGLAVHGKTKSSRKTPVDTIYFGWDDADELQHWGERIASARACAERLCEELNAEYIRKK